MNKSNSGYLYVSPLIIGLLVFIIFPLGFSLGLSFFNWDGLSKPSFVGLSNYADMLRDRVFWKSIRVTLLFAAIALPLNMIVGFFLAVALNRNNFTNRLLRLGYYVPLLISGVPLMVLWLWIFNSKYGLLNRFLSLWGIHGPSWFDNEFYAFLAMIIISIWGVGNYMLIFLASFHRIPSQLVEIVSLEGGTLKHKLSYVLFPYLSPILLFLLITGFVGHTQAFSQAYLITQGGPNNATLFFSFYLFLNAFAFSKIGYAAALSWVFFLLVTLVLAALFISSRLWVKYDEIDQL